jgi:sugar phosphate isomerase/epimerase
MKSAITITLSKQINTGPWVYWGECKKNIIKSVNYGFDGVELFTSSSNDISTSLLNTLSRQLNIKFSAVGTGAGKVIHGLTLTDPNPEIRKKAIIYITNMISFGASLGAPVIIGSMQGSVIPGIDRDQALEWLVEGLNTIGKIAEKQEINLIYEPLNRYETNLVNHFKEGVSLIGSLNINNISLLADLFHMNIEEPSIPETIRTYGKYIGYVHCSDSNRCAIGMGHTNISEIADALKETGYEGYLSAEIFPQPTSDEAAKQTITAFNQYFRTTKDPLAL